MNLQRLQKRTLDILSEAGMNDAASRRCNILLAILVILNVAAIVLESIAALEQRWGAWFGAFETFSIAVFSVEYLLRVWAGAAPHGTPPISGWRGRMDYILSMQGLADLISLLPYYLQMLFPGLDLRVLRVLRLVRVFKLSHYSTAVEDLFNAVRDERRSFFAAMYLLLIATVLTSCLMYFAEHEAQPEKFASIPDAAYWAVITLTTVGYGDVTPVTWAGKVLSLVTAFLGVCTVALLTGIVANSFVNQMARRKAMFESEVRTALDDGRLSEDERRMLEQLRKLLNMTAPQADQMVHEASVTLDRQGTRRRAEEPESQP